MELNNKIAVVTDGNRGIGRAISITLACELAPEVTVNAVVPGLVDTELFFQQGMDKLPKPTPLNRVAIPEKIAHFVIYLLENNYVSGEVMDIIAIRYMVWSEFNLTVDIKYRVMLFFLHSLRSCFKK